MYFIDEVAVGSAWNQKFRKEISSNLQVEEYLTNRGAESTLEWSTLYWGNILASGLSNMKKKILLISISNEGLKQQQKNQLKLSNSITFVSLNEFMKIKSIDLTSMSYDLIILLSPCQETHYINGMKLSDTLNCPIIALNSPYSCIVMILVGILIMNWFMLWKEYQKDGFIDYIPNRLKLF